MGARRVRLAERRAHAALIRAGFADQATAAQVLRQVQVLTRTRDLARLDYATADAAQAAIASLITSGAPAASPGPPVMSARQVSGTGQLGPALPSAARQDPDGRLIADAVRIVTDAARHGERLSQKALGSRLRREGHRVANHALRSLLAAAAGLAAGGQPPGDP